MKKKLIIFGLLLISTLSLSACGNKKINIANYLIEERNNLFTASDDLYIANFSTGKRENNYNFDGSINEMIDFGILTFSRIDNNALANDNYTYIVSINDDQHTGFLVKSEVDNSYSADLGICVKDEDEISVQVSFTGYTFNKQLENVSSQFNVDKNTALKIANKELSENLKNITQNNAKIEVVMKILKDYSSSELKNYFWYIGAISTNGETVGILIDANSGDIIAKKV